METIQIAQSLQKMKCPSVAALWASTPPSHNITAAVTLPEVSSLFTGGSDGSIIRWSISSSSITPISLLSGHAASISSLAEALQSCLLSACVNGVLCLWSGTASSRCKRRRKLPPWTGTPLIVKPDPVSDKTVLVLCGSAEMHNKMVRKYVLLMVDCVTLTVIKTVFHGGLTIGSPLEMGVFGSDAFLVDRTGRLQLLDILEVSNHDTHDGSVLSYTSNSSDTGSVSTIETDKDDLVQAAIFDKEGKIVALVYGSKCLFKWVSDGNIIGEILINGTSLYNEEKKDKLITGMFLEKEDSLYEDLDEGFNGNFALCSNNGAVIVYKISISGDLLFNFEPLCEIPPISTKSKVYFSHFNKYLVLIESNNFTILHISIWVFENSQSNPSCNKISSGGFFCEKSDSNEKFVSSSLILSKDSFVPNNIIYGFNTGEIEVISFKESKFNTGGIFPYISDKIFSGHTGPILCLATHLMHKKETNLNRVLISGSEDCTVRIWDLDSGVLLSVFHHHVKPVFQILLSPEFTSQPWNDCFLSLGEDGLVALLSLETKRVERVLTGHTLNPNLVAWDGIKGYIACLCKNLGVNKENLNVLYIWDLKTGACERIIHGSNANSMFDHFCKGIYKNALTGSVLGGTTSASSLLIPVFKDPKTSKKLINNNNNNKNPDTNSKGVVLRPAHDIRDDILGLGLGYSSSSKNKNSQIITQKEKKKAPIKCSCPFPGIATLQFDLYALMSPINHISCNNNSTDLQLNNSGGIYSPNKESPEGRLLRFSLCFLHLWGVDCELDELLVDEMNVCKPDKCQLATGTVGDRGAVSLMFPGTEPTLELWRSSPEFSAMRSLTMVSLAQHMISLSRSCTHASSALAAFYTRNFAEKVPDIKPPSLQLLVSFWQHQCEHVRMAARSLFHCAAPRAVPLPLSKPKPTADLQSNQKTEGSFLTGDLQSNPKTEGSSLTGDLQSSSKAEGSSITGGLQSVDEMEISSIIRWLDNFEDQEWVSWIGATNQDTMASNIIVAAALVVWYPSIVKQTLSGTVIHHLIKLLTSMNEKYSVTAAELLSEGMESTWIYHLRPEMTRFISNVLFQIECLSGKKDGNMVAIREALVDVLLPSLAMGDVLAFLGVIEGQIWGNASDSVVHVVAVKTVVRVVRGAPKILAPYLEKVINYVLHTMDPSNLVMRKACIITSMIAIKEITRVFPMVCLNEPVTRLAVGDAIGDISNTKIRIYDLESVTKIRILDASAPLGLPILLEGPSNNTKIATAISALSFSPDGEGLVAFSENGLMIRWWSFGTAWWERLTNTRSTMDPVQCTKLIFVPPWDGFSPNSSRLSIISSINNNNRHTDHEGKSKMPRVIDEADHMRLLVHNLDLSYRLQWVGPKTVKLTRYNQDLGTFPLS